MASHQTMIPRYAPISAIKANATTSQAVCIVTIGMTSYAGTPCSRKSRARNTSPSGRTPTDCPARKLVMPSATLIGTPAARRK